MSEWTDRNRRQADAAAQYEHIMTTPAPPAIGAYIDAGVIGFVFGEMWRRGVLTPRDRRWVTLACVGVAGAPVPMETHTYAALNSGDVTNEEIDEFLLFFGTQTGWPRGSAMNQWIITAMQKIAEERGEAWPDDTKRPLTDQGIARLRRAGRALVRLGLTPDVVLTSPLVRTRQTAEIIAGAFSHPGWGW